MQIYKAVKRKKTYFALKLFYFSPRIYYLFIKYIKFFYIFQYNNIVFCMLGCNIEMLEICTYINRLLIDYKTTM